MTGKICHVEIAVADMSAARAFYGDLFGWTWIAPGDEYTVFAAGDGVGGGLCLAKDRCGEGPVVLYIAVDDIPAMLDRIERAGGKTLQPKTAIGKEEWGFMAFFLDPFGNRMGLWAAK